MRVKGGPKAKNRRKRLHKLSEGMTGRARNTMAVTAEHVDRKLAYSYEHRKAKKRDFRALWITRITAAARARGFSYSGLVRAMKLKNVALNRKVLADLAATEPKAFDQVVKFVGLSA